MSTKDFVFAFVRFSKRYGIPTIIFTDNVKTFLSSSVLLNTIFTSSEFEEKYKAYSITFKQIPLYAAWYGACYERLIKTVKILSTNSLEDEQ